MEEKGIAPVLDTLVERWYTDDFIERRPDAIKARIDQVLGTPAEVFLSVSSEVLPTVRFYNRVSTTVLNAYAGPILRGYLDSLTARLGEAGFSGILLIMQSNGGVASPQATLERPAKAISR